jgi:hypothetical protein
MTLSIGKGRGHIQPPPRHGGAGLRLKKEKNSEQSLVVYPDLRVAGFEIGVESLL